MIMRLCTILCNFVFHEEKECQIIVLNKRTGVLLSDRTGAVACSYLQDCHQLAHSKNTIMHNVNIVREESVLQVKYTYSVVVMCEYTGNSASACASLKTEIT